MKTKKIITVLLILAVICGLFFYVLHLLNKSCNGSEPNKPSNVPINTFWKGDCDEGYWFEIVDINAKENNYRFRIYNDYKGELEIDANFRISANCKFSFATKEELENKIFYFEENKIKLSPDTCDLEMVTPPFGGKRWEVEKDIIKQTW